MKLLAIAIIAFALLAGCSSPPDYVGTVVGKEHQVGRAGLFGDADYFALRVKDAHGEVHRVATTAELWAEADHGQHVRVVRNVDSSDYGPHLLP